VVNITNVSFRAGAATNIEVIDAERRWVNKVRISRHEVPEPADEKTV